MEGVLFPFWDTEKFMMTFTVQDTKKIAQKIRDLSGYTYHQESADKLRIKARRFCVDIDYTKNEIAVIAAHDQVQTHERLFREVFA